MSRRSNDRPHGLSSLFVQAQVICDLWKQGIGLRLMVLRGGAL